MNLSPMSAPIVAGSSAITAAATHLARPTNKPEPRETQQLDPPAQSPSLNENESGTRAASLTAVEDRQQLSQAVERMRQSLPALARNLQFKLDDDTGKTVVTVVDSSTNEVIRQIPSEELLVIAKALDTFTSLITKQKV